jgi:hypothetical protein
LPDGTIVTEHKEKEQLIFNTYKERLGTSHAPEMLFDLQHIIQPMPGLEELSVPFTTEEIDLVVKHMPVDKASGPDGFNGQFLKS